VAAGIFAGFAALLAVTVVIARRSYEGLVERNYYESAAGEFAAREAEARAGFRMTVPERYRAGENRFAAILRTDDGPLRGARVTLDAMNPSGTGEDRSFDLREESPGVYVADLVLPRPGSWMFSLAADSGTFRARRRWTAVALPDGDPLPPGTLRAAAGTQRVILSLDPWPPRAMEEIAFDVSLPGYEGDAPPRVELSMPGMEMGRNRVPLSRSGDGHFRGTGLFVRCPSGKRDWVAAVSVPGRGKAVFRVELAD
jgi:nitrogen fixation protein FixH